MKLVGPRPYRFMRMNERIFNTGTNVLSLTDVGQTELVPLSSGDEDNDLFIYDSTNKTLSVKSDGIKDLSLFANVNAGAASANIVFLMEESDSPTTGFTPVSFGLMKEYIADGGSLQIFTTLFLTRNKYYRVVAYNNDGGDVIYTTDTYTINGNEVLSPAFLMTMST